MNTRPQKSIVFTDLSAAASTRHTAVPPRPDADVPADPRPCDALLRVRRKMLLLHGCVRGGNLGVDTAVPGMPGQHDHAVTAAPGVRPSEAEGVRYVPPV
jgi:hypothetical protein